MSSSERGTREAATRLTPYLVDQSWLWRIRLEQVVGHVGFHGPPDDDGMVGVAYAVDPHHRRRGFATARLGTARLGTARLGTARLGTARLGTALEWAASEPGVRTVRASVSPDNAASLATLRPYGFVHVGEQWDGEDGVELVLERRAAK